MQNSIVLNKDDSLPRQQTNQLKFVITPEHQIYLNTIPVNKAHYITGFADGEGNFDTFFIERNDFLIGFKISPVFSISQKEKAILAIIKNHLGCGTTKLRNDGVWVYQVYNKNMIIDRIIPFFSKFPFLSTKKKKDFSRFKKLVSIIYNNKSKTYDDIVFICKLLEEIPCKNSRKFTNEIILNRAAKYWALNKEIIEKLNLNH
jgi:hypothetical protein